MDSSKCNEWLINRNKVPIINPLTNRTLTMGGPTYQKLDKDCMSTIHNQTQTGNSTAGTNMNNKPAEKHENLYTNVPQEVRIGLTDSGKGIWVCGTATHTYKSDMPTLGGAWNSSQKCWVFSLKRTDDLIDFFVTKGITVHNDTTTSQNKTNISNPIKATTSAPSTPTDAIKTVKNITVSADGDLIYICGQSTYAIKEWLKSTLKARWNPSTKCWFINSSSKPSLVQYLTSSNLVWTQL